ncbi:MAG: SEC-C metal-binding domain-containing protein [Pseudomonadota bacterium]
MIFTQGESINTSIANLTIDGICCKYLCDFSVCENPVCTCSVLNLNVKQNGLINENEIKQYNIELDVVERKLAYKNQKEVTIENMNFANLFISKLSDFDFDFLYKKHFTLKNVITENTELDKIDAKFDYYETESEGLLYSYKDVLPYGDELYLTIEDELYLIMDQHCLLPKCKCTETILSIYKTKDSNNRESGAAKLDYKKMRWQNIQDEKFPISFHTLKTSVESQIINLKEVLFKRHTKLKTIYANCVKRDFQIIQNVKTEKVGRNSPCPCGSGKKYKKCCGK